MATQTYLRKNMQEETQIIKTYAVLEPHSHPENIGKYEFFPLESKIQ